MILRFIRILHPPADPNKNRSETLILFSINFKDKKVEYVYSAHQ